LSGDNGEIKMIQPFDFSVKIYGATVWRPIALHYRSSVGIGGLNGYTHVRPWNLSYVEKLVVSPSNDAVLDIRSADLVLVGGSKETTGECRKRTWDIIIFKFIHLPAGHDNAFVRRSIVVGCFHQFLVRPSDGIKPVDKLRGIRHRGQKSSWSPS